MYKNKEGSGQRGGAGWGGTGTRGSPPAGHDGDLPAQSALASARPQPRQPLLSHPREHPQWQRYLCKRFPRAKPPLPRLAPLQPAPRSEAAAGPAKVKPKPSCRRGDGDADRLAYTHKPTARSGPLLATAYCYCSVAWFPPATIAEGI